MPNELSRRGSDSRLFSWAFGVKNKGCSSKKTNGILKTSKGRTRRAAPNRQIKREGPQKGNEMASHFNPNESF
jgi:hypothetical protein